MSQYSEIIRQWATDTRRAGCIAGADGTGEVGLDSGQAGRRVAVRFTLKVELDRVADARYEVFGCGFSMAACAVAADLAVGCSLDTIQDVDAIRLGMVLDGLPSDRSYCADLAVEALQAAASSARNNRDVVASTLSQEPHHGPRVMLDDPIYSQLMKSPRREAVSFEDRHLFACLIAVAAQESEDLAVPLGLQQSDLDSILLLFFPGQSFDLLECYSSSAYHQPVECNPDVLSILLSHVPADSGFHQVFVSLWLARILATRAALPGHLWVAMGLTERPQLTAAIRRHLPSLADANHQNMRWKRYLYKQVCDLNGGVMCKAPNCGICSDYGLCFVADEG